MTGLVTLAVATLAWTAEPVDDAKAVTDEMVKLYAAGKFEAAEVLAMQAVAINRAELGDDHPEVGRTLINVGAVRHAQGDYPGASEILEEAVANLRAALGDDDLEVASAMGSLAAIAQEMGDYPKARGLLEESLVIWRRTGGDGHPKTARIMNNLASLLRAQGELAEALPLAEGALAIKREALGEDHPSVAISLDILASLQQDIGDYDAARPVFVESLNIRKDTFGAGHPNVAASLNNLAGLLVEEGDFAGARPLYELALKIYADALGEDHPERAGSLNALAKLLKAQGDYDAAIPLVERSLALRRKALGDDHPDVAKSLGSLAAVLHKKGDHGAARPLYEESLAIWRSSLGDDHYYVAIALNRLASVFTAEKKFGDARALYAESLEIQRRSLGDNHPEVAASLGNLAAAYGLEGRRDEAAELFEQSLAIRRAAFGDDHPEVAKSLDHLADILEAQGNGGAARPLRAEAIQIVEARLSLLDALSEREALAYLPSIRGALDGWIANFSDADHDVEAWTHTLRFKGASAARLAAARVSTRDDPEAAALSRELAEIRGDLARLMLSADLGDRKDRLAALTTERDRVERELLTRSAAHRMARDVAGASPADLCASLPDDAALVDVFRYQRRKEAHYVAFAVMAGACDVTRVELGAAEALDDAVADWREAMEDPDAVVTRVDGRGLRVAELFWTPLGSVVGDAEHLFLVPDGALASAPFAALPMEDGSYLLEKQALTWLDRANDLLVEAAAPAIGALVVGDVDYDATSAGASERRGALAPCNTGEFLALPGATAESEALVERWSRSRRKEPLVHLGGADATESAVVRALRGKSVVHLATHGFFATGKCKSALEGDSGVGFDPMVLSGLVLAGANQPADPLAPEDGILTAAEVAALDLSGTGLVVLSACETGLGEIQSGEGVLGLRRAFSVAGARTLVMTLWSVPDDETASLMEEFYRLHLHRRRPQGAATALRRAQLNALESQRSDGVVRPGIWAGFVAAGDWR